MREITFAKAINEALHQALAEDSSVITYGLGVDDPKGVFGTTLGLQEHFGPDRVFDMPTAENAMTGVAIGASLNGIRPVMTHQRLDFFLLAMDQLVNNAAKWYYMFGCESVPITIRLILGRGWGQGPTHSQNLQAWFAHIPGLKVVAPTTPQDAKGLLLASIFDDNPVIFLEHRWLHNQLGHVPENLYTTPIGTANLIAAGNDLTIVASSYMTLEAKRAVSLLNANNIMCDLIDLRSIKPIDWKMILDSVKKTGRLLVLDTSSTTGSISGEIIARVSTEAFDTLKAAPQRLALPDAPTPTSFALTETFYNNSIDIVMLVEKMVNKKIPRDQLTALKSGCPHDVPADWFKGPF